MTGPAESPEIPVADSSARRVARAELERYRFVLLYAQRQRLKAGDYVGVARTLRRKAKITLRTLSVLCVIWYIGFVLSLRYSGPRSDSPVVGILWWALILVLVLREQVRVETSMRIVLGLLEEEEADRRSEPPPGA